MSNNNNTTTKLNNSVMIVLTYLSAMSDNSMTIKDYSFFAVMEAIAFLLANPEAIRVNTQSNSVKEFIPRMREFIGGYGTDSYNGSIKNIIESSNENKQLTNYILSKLGVYPSYYPDTRMQDTIINTTTRSPYEIITELQSREELYFHIFKQFLENQGNMKFIRQFNYTSAAEIPAFSNDDSRIPKVFHTTIQRNNEVADNWLAVSTVITDITRIGSGETNHQENIYRSLTLFDNEGYLPLQIAIVYAYIYFSYLIKHYHFALLSENVEIIERIKELGEEYELFLSGDQTIGLELFIRYFIPEIVFEKMKVFMTVNNSNIHSIRSILYSLTGDAYDIPNPDFFVNPYKVGIAALRQETQAELEQIQNEKTQQIYALLNQSPEGVQETLLQQQLTQGLNIPGSIAILRKYGQGSLADEIENMERTTNEAIKQLPEQLRQRIINYQNQLSGISENTGNQSSVSAPVAAAVTAAATTTSSSSSYPIGAGAAPITVPVESKPSYKGSMRIRLPQGSVQPQAQTIPTSSSESIYRPRTPPPTTSSTTTTTSSSSSGLGGSGGKRVARRKTKKQRRDKNKRRGTKKH